MIVLPNGLTSAEIRVLQEFRRLNAESLTLEQVNAIKHPAGGGEAPAASLLTKGYLSSTPEGAFAITQSGKEFLAIEAKPLVAETSDAAATAASDPQAGGV